MDQDQVFLMAPSRYAVRIAPDRLSYLVMDVRLSNIVAQYSTWKEAAEHVYMLNRQETLDHGKR
jgi:hypothetical protein